MIHLSIYQALFVFALLACSAPRQVSTTLPDGVYYEDLSSTRPPVVMPAVDTSRSNPQNARDPHAYVEARHTVNAQVDAVLDSIDRINLSRKFIDGFTIQVYSGTKKEDALAARKDLTTYLPDLESEVQYLQPNFRVKTGAYYSRLEAQRDYQLVKKHFAQAIIVPDRIPNQ
jgi:hypothetical protein